MDAVRHVADRNLALGPARKQRLEDMPADPSMLAADANAKPRTPHGQVSHIEWLGGVVRSAATEGQQFRERHADFIKKTLEVMRIRCDQLRRKPIKRGFDRSMGRENVAGARRPERLSEQQPRPALERPCPLDHDKGGIPLVQVADLGLRRDRFDDAPAGDPENQLLEKSDLTASLVKPSGDATIGRAVERIVGIEKVERNAPDLRLPNPQHQHSPWEREWNVQPRAVGTARRTDRQGAGVVGRVTLLLPPAGIDALSEIAIAIEQADADRRYSEMVAVFR